MAAVVLASEDNGYFSPSALRRSHSQPKFVTKTSGFHSSSSATRLGEPYHAKAYPDSAPSSAPSSPRTNQPGSSDLSWASTPASNLSVNSDFDDTILGVQPEDHFVLPQYDSNPFFTRPVEDLEPPASPRTGDSYTVSPADNDNSADTSRPGSPDVVEPSAADDTAVRVQPSRHVDYLSHNWREEDIWSSWKLIISRRGDYANSDRLENASWRTWMKAKNKLKTVSPETLNWLKDCDVTWLYGPLQPGPHNIVPTDTSTSSSKLSRSNSFSSSKKPILKKRSMSEIMLQRSLSNSSLVKQAAAAVQAQEKEGGRRRMLRPALERAATDYVSMPFSSRRMSGNDLSSLSSVDTSGLTSPSGERKHIHFNEQVEQCIAVEIRGDEEDDDVDTDRFPENSDSDDGGLTMKRMARKKRPVLKKKKAKAPTPSDNKIIAMLPSTTLKSREESVDDHDTAQKHTVYRSPVMSPSSSQETLRPSKVASKKLNLVFDDDDDDDDDDEDEDEDDEEQASAPAFRGMGAASSSEEKPSTMQRSPSSNSLNAEPAGMRRTSSGMFMPYEEGDSSATEGIFGRVIDTVNTARDIAHVIWNVGWRK